MSKADIEVIVSRAKKDPDFARGLAADFAGTLKFAGYHLGPDEIEATKKELAETLATVPVTPPPANQFPDLVSMKFQQEFLERKMKIALDRFEKLSEYTANMLRDTLESARSAYKRIVWMNTIMFVTGISLFIFAALYGAFSQQQKIYSLVFGGLGVANFVALFMTDPITKTQKALSNLVQVEIAFMNFFEQMTIWDAFVFQPPINLANVEKASAAIQERSLEIIRLLEGYVEDAPDARTQPVRTHPNEVEAKV